MPTTRMISVDVGNKAYRALLTPEPEGGFTVTVPELPGCITCGENIDHAVGMAKEAIELYLETLGSEQQPSGPHHPIISSSDRMIF